MTAAELQIGHWYAPCCLHDLHRINDAEGLEDARRWIEDAECFGARAWPTVDEALRELLPEEAGAHYVGDLTHAESHQRWRDYQREHYPEEYAAVTEALERLRRETL